MASYHDALRLAALGLKIFPVRRNEKIPAINDFSNQATDDPTQLHKWWIEPGLEIDRGFNIGICTSHFKDDLALIVVDIDNKGKDGYASLDKLVEEGKDIPVTFSQKTPSG